MAEAVAKSRSFTREIRSCAKAVFNPFERAKRKVEKLGEPSNENLMAAKALSAKLQKISNDAFSLRIKKPTEKNYKKVVKASELEGDLIEKIKEYEIALFGFASEETIKRAAEARSTQGSHLCDLGLGKEAIGPLVKSILYYDELASLKVKMAEGFKQTGDREKAAKAYLDAVHIYHSQQYPLSSLNRAVYDEEERLVPKSPRPVNVNTPENALKILRGEEVQIEKHPHIKVSLGDLDALVAKAGKWSDPHHKSIAVLKKLAEYETSLDGQPSIDTVHKIQSQMHSLLINSWANERLLSSYYDEYAEAASTYAIACEKKASELEKASNYESAKFHYLTSASVYDDIASMCTSKHNHSSDFDPSKKIDLFKEVADYYGLSANFYDKSAWIEQISVLNGSPKPETLEKSAKARKEQAMALIGADMLKEAAEAYTNAAQKYEEAIRVLRGGDIGGFAPKYYSDASECYLKTAQLMEQIGDWEGRRNAYSEKARMHREETLVYKNHWNNWFGISGDSLAQGAIKNEQEAIRKANEPPPN